MSSPPDPYAHLAAAERARAAARGQADAALSVRGKVDLVARYLSLYPRRVAIETGLWEGWGTLMRLSEDELRPVDKVVLIDLQASNCERARSYMPLHLAALDCEVREGDSARELVRVLEAVDEPAFFWLDAHDPELPVPLWAELSAIVAHAHAREHVVLVDDVRMMAEPWEGFPTLDRVLWLAEPYWTTEIADDVLRLTPR